MAFLFTHPYTPLGEGNIGIHFLNFHHLTHCGWILIIYRDWQR